MIFSKKEYKFNDEIKEVTVLGLPGCGSCEALFLGCQKVLEELGADIKPVYIKDMEKLKEKGLMTVPALLVNGNVISCGKSLSVKKLKEIFGQKI